MFCKEPRQKSIFWHNIWCDGGRPRSGIVAELMRKSIARCHLSVKYIRKHTKKRNINPQTIKSRASLTMLLGDVQFEICSVKSIKCCITVYYTDWMI